MKGKKAPAKRKTKSKSVSIVASRAANTPASPEKPASAQPRAGSKLAKLLVLLGRPGGATIEALVKATDWQAHSVRGAISGTLRKKLGIAVKSERRPDGERIYSIA